mmetsp:Transcript_24536/g.32869  ORF Transcript_24536/g.32869 Transcript_24536/m.32869 type:complete len:122 (-) Transcript_24536:59-424(-)
MHLWTVVRVLQHMSAAKAEKREGELNLSSDDSISVEDESDLYADQEEETASTTIEMPGFQVQERDPVPEGFIRKPELHEQTNPRLTLVFLAYEKPVADVRKHATLINVSHIAHKFSQSGSC